MNKPWFVYIAKTPQNKFYIGITTNVITRIKKHNSGKGSWFARENGMFVLVYSSTPYSNKSEARKREIQLKGWTRVKKEKLISGEWR